MQIEKKNWNVKSVKLYEELAEFTSGTYLHGNDLMGSHWKDIGLEEFRKVVRTK